MSAQQGQAQGQAQGQGKVKFSEAVGEGTAHSSTEYNRTRGATAPVGQGSPNFHGPFKARGTPQGNSGVSALAGQMAGLTLGQGQGHRKSRKGKKSRKSRKSRKVSRKH